MRPLVVFRWSYALVLLPVLMGLAWLTGAAERGSFEGYWLYPYAQGLSAAGFIDPVVAGWAAWTFGSLQTVLRTRPVVRPPVVVAAQVLWPGVVAGFVVVQVLALILSDGHLPTGGLRLSLAVLVCVAACTALGAAAGLFLRRTVAAPLVLVATFLWLAYPISSSLGWLRTSNTVSALQSCCTSDTQVSHLWWVASLTVSSVWVVGLLLLLVAPARRLALLRTGVVLVLTVGLAGGFALGRRASLDGLEPRDTPVTCTSNPAGLRWCVWPEDAALSRQTGTQLEPLTARLQRLGLPTPSVWSTSTTHPPDAAELTVRKGASHTQQRAAFAIATVQWWRCDDRAEANLTAWLLVTVGVSQERVAHSVDPAAWSTARDHLGIGSAALAYWNSTIRRSCQPSR